MPRYNFVVDGTGAMGAPWSTNGTVETERPGDFPQVALEALRQSYMALTEGRAIYGDPGTCSGPYKIKHLSVTLVDDVH